MSVSVTQLIDYLQDARKRTLELVNDLTREQLMSPKLEIVNPLLWEIGHVAWFHERWVLRHLDGRPALLPNGDEVYDSAAIPHDVRWELLLPSFDDTRQYMKQVLHDVVERLRRHELDEQTAYFCQLTVFHEDMHDEAFIYTRQTLGYPRPNFEQAAKGVRPEAGALPGDVEVPGGRFMLGASTDQGFVFDNEKWGHTVEVEPFSIARAPVTNEEFTRFVVDGGYRHRELWDDEGWAWCEKAGLEEPVYWRRDGASWKMRQFDQWMPLTPHTPVIHVNWYEVQAYCRWAGRRLPTEAEWEMAAACEPSPDGKGIAAGKRRYPWGNAAPAPAHANLDGRWLGCVDVAAFPAGDSAFGCRQMFGNVWEWTATTFEPYPGFSVDPYKEYSEPWFGTRKVLRGGSWVTRSRTLWNTWRNFFTPDRNDVFAGFRTCALHCPQ